MKASDRDGGGDGRGDRRGDRAQPGERGAIGGIEVLPIGFLLFVVGLLLVVNVWSVIDAKLAAGAAAREAARTAVESSDAAEALACAALCCCAWMRAIWASIS